MFASYITECGKSLGDDDNDDDDGQDDKAVLANVVDDRALACQLENLITKTQGSTHFNLARHSFHVSCRTC